MLLASLFTGAKSIVLMKPSLPISWFDLAIIPKHDGVTNKKNVITTKGVLNTVQHSTIKDPTKGLILIGGASKHFSWNSKKIAQQVNAIISRTPHINWQLTTLNHLDLLQENLQVIPYEDTDSQWVNTQLEQASQTWVSVDSSSMIFEALTSGTNVGIFDLPANKNSRLQRCVNQLINDHLVMPFNTWEKSKQLYPNMAQLHESSRCANLIMDNTIENSQSAEHYPSPA
jgi:mitochondrial fission protein ELM1